jgi:hypothetical protein
MEGVSLQQKRQEQRGEAWWIGRWRGGIRTEWDVRHTIQGETVEADHVPSELTHRRGWGDEVGWRRCIRGRQEGRVTGPRAGGSSPRAAATSAAARFQIRGRLLPTLVSRSTCRGWPHRGAAHTGSCGPIPQMQRMPPPSPSARSGQSRSPLTRRPHPVDPRGGNRRGKGGGCGCPSPCAVDGKGDRDGHASARGWGPLGAGKEERKKVARARG